MLTVLFATRNRADILRSVLHSYCSLGVPVGGWQLLVVDNDSNDRTPHVLEEFRNRLPLKCLIERNLGKNHALNLGLGHIAGDLVVLTDDDVFPRHDWLKRMRAAADDHSGYDFFGGLILPRWEVRPPKWIEERVPLAMTYGLNGDIATGEGPTPGNAIFGANMAVRSAVFAKGVRFDPNIGPRGENYPMGSETELIKRLRKAGYSAWFAANAVVEHLIRSHQLSRRWILQRAMRSGRGQWRLQSQTESPSGVAMWGPTPRWLYRCLLGAAGRAVGAACTFNNGALFSAQWEFEFQRGRIIESWHMRAESPARK